MLVQCSFVVALPGRAASVVNAGLRLGDICALEWACLKEPGKVVVWTDKRDTRVDLPVDDDLAQGLAAIPANSDKVCFPEQEAISRSSKRSMLSVQFGRTLQAVGIQGHSFTTSATRSVRTASGKEFRRPTLPGSSATPMRQRPRLICINRQCHEAVQRLPLWGMEWPPGSPHSLFTGLAGAQPARWTWVGLPGRITIPLSP
jgi:hypothetical protein